MNNYQNKKIREQINNESSYISPFFYGVFAKNKRKELGNTLSNISKDLKVSKGNLSEMENGIRFMKNSLFQKFLSYYSIQFDSDLHCYFEVKEMLRELVNCFLRLDEIQHKKVREQFHDFYTNKENSYAFLVGKLFLYFEKVVYEQKEDDKDFSILEDSLLSLTNDEKALFFSSGI